MKKLLILSLIAFFALGSAKVFADGLTPEAGSTHSYWVNSDDNGANQKTDHQGNFYTWYVVGGVTPGNESTVDFTNPIPTPTDFAFATGQYNTQTPDLYKVSVTWNASSIGKVYYLVGKEVVSEGGNPTGCSNMKVLKITPTNNFTLQYVALTSAGNTTDDNVQCAPDITLSANSTAITYNYGVGTYEFELIPSGLDPSVSWSFKYQFDNTVSVTPTVEYSVNGGAFSAMPASAVNISSGTSPVIVRVTLDNGSASQANDGSVSGTFNEGTTGQSIKLTLSDILDVASNAVTKVTNNAGTDITGAAVQTQTINARPATTIGHD